MSLPLPMTEPSTTADFGYSNLYENLGLDEVGGTETAPLPNDPWNADLEYFVPVPTVDGRIEIIQNRRKADRRGPKRRQDDRLADLAEYVERLESIRNQTARGWAMFAMGFSSGMVMVLAFMFLTS